MYQSVQSDTDNLQSKYTRLCAEFKKLRENHVILKQALLEEREQRGAVQLKLRDLEIRSRQFDQEQESLQFRNVHLAKQVEYLQLQLEAERQQHSSSGHYPKKHSKGNTHKPGEAATPEAALDEYKVLLEQNLQQRIEECAQLHSRMSELSLEAEQTRQGLQQVVASLENEVAQKMEEHRRAMQRHQTELERARDDKAALEVKLILLEREVANLQAEKASWVTTQAQLCAGDSSSSTSATLGPSTDLLPSGNHPGDIVATNSPCAPRLQASDLQDFLEQLKSRLRPCFTSWLCFLAQWEQALSCEQGNPDPWTEVRALSTELESLVQFLVVDCGSPEVGSVGLGGMARAEDALQRLGLSLQNNLSPCLQTLLEKEFSSRVIDCGGGPRHNDIVNCIRHIADLILRVHSLIHHTPATNDSSLSWDECGTQVDQLLDSVEQLALAMKKLSRVFLARVALLRESCGDGAVVGLCQQYEALAELLSTLQTHLGEVLCLLRSSCVPVQTCLFSGQQRHVVKVPNPVGLEVESEDSATASLLSSSTPSGVVSPHQSVPTGPQSTQPSQPTPKAHRMPQSHHSATQLRLMEDDRWSSLSERSTSPPSLGLAASHWASRMSAVGSVGENWEKRVSALLDRVASLETRANESSLVAQMALYRLAVARKVRTMLEVLLKQHGVAFVIPEEWAEMGAEGEELAILPGSLEETGPTARPCHALARMDHDSVRERLLVQHFNVRCEELHALLEMSQAQGHHLQAECHSLQARLKIEEAQKVKLTEIVDKLNVEIARVKEDLECTQENYNASLAQMSDHISSLNQQLTDQDHKLDLYKAQAAQAKKSIFSLKK